MTCYTSFAHVKPATLSQTLTGNCLTAFMEISQLEKLFLPPDPEKRSLLIEKTIQMVRFSEETFDSILGYLNNFTLTPIPTADAVGTEMTQLEQANCEREEEYAQMRQLVYTVIDLNDKLDRIIKRIQLKSPGANLPKLKTEKEIEQAVPKSFEGSTFHYVRPCLSIPTPQTTTLQSVEFSTRLEVDCDVGYGNTLCIAGVGGDWDPIPMSYENGKWCYTLKADNKQNCLFKFAVNSQWEDFDGNHELEIGRDPHLALTIHMPTLN